jgi:uracil-DNA glycosylase
LLLPQMLGVEVVLLVGMYAQRHYLGGRRQRTLTDTVAAWRDYAPRHIPLPHPSWRNTHWRKKNPWFEVDVVPMVRDRVAELV